MSSRDKPGEYEHRFHVGNVGDVLKHTLLAAIFDAAADVPMHYVDSHAGGGRYKLDNTGEWRAGVAEVLAGEPAAPALRRYAEVIADVGIWTDRGRVYPGSPNLAQALLKHPDARLHLIDSAEAACADLRKYIGSRDPRAEIACTDGYERVPALVNALPPGPALVLVDPPYSSKADWHAAAALVRDVLGRRPDASVVLWYPVISHSRPNALLAELEAATVRGRMLELVTTPLALKKRRLNGSGVVCFGVDDGVLDALLLALPEIGATCATHDGAWSLRAATVAG